MSRIDWLNLPGHRPGETLNISSGCKHGCVWKSGKRLVRCYARSFARRFCEYYPDGFDAYYWHSERLEIPGKVTEPTGWFIDSMGDLLGAWVPKAHTQQVLDMCRAVSWHTFFILTKCPGRLPLFEYPSNVWVGFSSPPDFMNKHWLTEEQKARYVRGGLKALAQTKAGGHLVSVEPFKFNISAVLETLDLVGALDWMVAGGVSGGGRAHQPPAAWVRGLLDVADRYHIPVFLKGNLLFEPQRRDWPAALGATLVLRGGH